MVEQICEGLYRIHVALRGNPLRSLNSYVIVSRGGNLLIDTGFRNPECQRDLQDGLDELGVRIEDTDVLVTHLHSDHSGMADLFAGADRRIYMSGVDLDYLRWRLASQEAGVHRGRYRSEGYPEDLNASAYRDNKAFSESLRELDARFTPIADGDMICACRFRLRTIMVPGHTPGNCMFYDADRKIMFTGDHILFDITPNITAWPTMEDALGNYIDSLHKAEQYDVRLSLPGHRETGNYEDRIQAILAHHERRLNEVIHIIEDTPGLCGYEIAARMRWRIHTAHNTWEEYPAMQKWFAMGECLSHLDHLRKKGVISMTERDGLRRYYSAG